jgi:hypothetical protein
VEGMNLKVLEEGRKTHEATLINSVKPPNHITSGWMMAKDRFSINFLKPYLSSVRAHGRSECAKYAVSRGEAGEKEMRGQKLTWNTRVHQW